jgi:hypothetical protein
MFWNQFCGSGIRDPVLFVFFYPGVRDLDPGWKKNPDRDPDEHPGSYFRELGNNFLG